MIQANTVFVLDTNTISYYFRGQPDVVAAMQSLSPSELGVPVIVAYELRYGLLRLPKEAAVPRLKALAKLLGSMQSLSFDATCAAHAAEIRVQLEQQGTPIGAHDVLIAATALSHQGTLITRNVREFSRVQGLRVVNWHHE